MVTVAVVVVAVAVLVAAQLPGQFPGHQINAGVEVFAAFLGADHGAIGEDRHLRGLLRNPGIAGHREMHVRLFHHPVEMTGRALQLLFGVLADGWSDLQIAAVNHELHPLPPGRWTRLNARNGQ